MTFQEMIRMTKENDGVGAVFFYNDGCVVPYFYENFSKDDPGINRAERDSGQLFKAGKIHKTAYYWKNETGYATPGEEIKVHFYEWDTSRKIHTRQDGTIYKVYKKDGISGIDYNNNFSPLDNFCGRSVVFEIVK